MIRLGTRASPLAMAQALTVQQCFVEATGQSHEDFPLVPMTSSGDRIIDRSLVEAGGKGLFAKELEIALTEGLIDLAVHSAKDMETFLPKELRLMAALEREDPRDALISRNNLTLENLPSGAKVGTASKRREALLRRFRPDLLVSLIRGNVQTRLQRLDDGEFDATLLAMAGLRRVSLERRASHILPTQTFLPSAGQGIIALEGRKDDEETARLAALINHQDSWQALLAERAFLARIDGSCQTPVGAHAHFEPDGTVTLNALILAPDGSFHHSFHASSKTHNPEALGAHLGNEAMTKLSREEKEIIGLMA